MAATWNVKSRFLTYETEYKDCRRYYKCFNKYIPMVWNLDGGMKVHGKLIHYIMIGSSTFVGNF